MEEHYQESESQPKTWIEIQEENGVPVEYLMTTCENCGQNSPRQRILRFNEDELREWQMSREEFLSTQKRGKLLATLFLVYAPIALIITGIATLSETNIIAPAVFIALAFALVIFYPRLLWRRKKRHASKLEGRRRKILARHGDILWDKVGMVDQCNQKWVRYVILPAMQEEHHENLWKN